MPFIRLRYTGHIAPSQQQALAEQITTLMEEILHKKAALTAVLIEPVTPATHWSIGRQAQPLAVHLEANITQGTNSAAEKAAFIAQAKLLLHTQFGTLPQASYIIVREIPATDWGYDGVTQAARR